MPEAAIAAGKGSRANRVTSNPRLTLPTDLEILFDAEWAKDQDPKNPRPLFKEAASVALFSEDIVTELVDIEDRPWAEWGDRRSRSRRCSWRACSTRWGSLPVPSGAVP